MKRHDCPAYADPDLLDLWLIRLTYRLVATEWWCTRCGARLRRRVRVVPFGADRAGPPVVSVVTRCRGWRRHRHTAIVDELGNDLVLGRFRPD
jgi:hypothetical protein